MMASTFGGFNTAVSGLAAQQLNINTAGHNVSNASTDGYSRQRVNLVTTIPEAVYTASGKSYLGTGVTTQSITRARDFLVDAQYWQQNSTKSYWQNQSDSLGNIENIFSDTKTTGLQNVINKFNTALGTLASHPDGTDGISARTVVRETANALAQTLQQDAASLVQQANDISTRIDAQVTQVNNYTSQIAALNKQIIVQEVGGVKANDLRDKRDYLVDQLSSMTSVNVSEDQSGAYTVSIAGGIPLVQGDDATVLTVKSTANTPPYGYTTTSITANGGAIDVIMKDGSIASLTKLRDETIGGTNGYLKKLDDMAQFFMQDFNTQHKKGFDMNGAAGDNFFGTTGVDYTLTANDPTAQIPPTSWISKLTVNSAFYAKNGENLIAAQDSNAVTGGTANGLNATALSNLLVKKPSTPSAALGSNSLSDYYGSVISALGVQSQQAQSMNSNQGVIVNATIKSREQISGVDMNEELANIIKYQQAYGACAKVMTTMDSMLDTLINKTSVG
jgi:flagellar hook-associated protein 1 FlgK